MNLRASSRASYLLLLSLLCSAIFIGLNWKQIRLSDDNLFLMATGQYLLHPHRTQQKLTTIEDWSSASADSEVHYRYVGRNKYFDNYVGVSAIYAAGITLISWTATFAEHSTQIAAMAVSMFMLTPILFILVFSAAASIWCRDWVIDAFVLASILMLVISLIFPGTPTFITFIPNDPGESLRNLVAFMIEPIFNGQFSAYGLTPRGQNFLFAALFFMLRWSGRPIAALWILPALCFLHQSHATLLFYLIVVAEVIRLGDRILSLKWFAPVLVTQLVILSRENILDTFGVSDVWFFSGVTTVFVLAVGAVVAMERYLTRNWAVFARCLVAIRDWSLPALDLAILFGGWLITVPAGMAACNAASGFSGKYLWCQLHARIYAMLFLPFLMAALLLLRSNSALFAGMERSLKANAGRVNLALICVALIYAASEILSKPMISDVMNQARHLEAQSVSSIAAGPPTTENERYVYYLLVSDLATGGDRMNSAMSAGKEADGADR